MATAVRPLGLSKKTEKRSSLSPVPNPKREIGSLLPGVLTFLTVALLTSSAYVSLQIAGRYAFDGQASVESWVHHITSSEDLARGWISLGLTMSWSFLCLVALIVAKLRFQRLRTLLS